MIDRASYLLEALAGRGDRAAVEIVSAIRADGVSADAIADGIDDVAAALPEPRVALGGHPLLLAVTSLVAAIAGTSGLYQIDQTFAFPTRLWVLLLLLVPVLGWSTVKAARSRGRISAIDGQSAESFLLARGISLAHARSIVSFLNEGAGPAARPGLGFAAAAAVTLVFWASYFKLVAQAMFWVER